MLKICATCRFWQDDGGPVRSITIDSYSYRPGKCRRYAPKPGNSGIYWPQVQHQDWCGEHEPAPSPQEGAK